MRDSTGQVRFLRMTHEHGKASFIEGGILKARVGSLVLFAAGGLSVPAAGVGMV